MVSLTSDDLLPESDAMADVLPYSSQDAKPVQYPVQILIQRKLKHKYWSPEFFHGLALICIGFPRGV